MDVLIYLIIIIVLIVSIYSAYYFVKRHLENESKMVQKIKSTLEDYGTLKEEGLYMQYTYNEITYQVLLFKIGKGVKLTFNSKTIWEKRFGDTKQFTDQTIFSKLPGKKIVIVYPHEGPFMYHYDENEIRFTNPKEKVWDMHIIAAASLSEALKEGF